MRGVSVNSWFCSVMVITLDSDSNNPGSIPGRTSLFVFFCFFLNHLLINSFACFSFALFIVSYLVSFYIHFEPLIDHSRLAGHRPIKCRKILMGTKHFPPIPSTICSCKPCLETKQLQKCRILMIISLQRKGESSMMAHSQTKAQP